MRVSVSWALSSSLLAVLGLGAACGSAAPRAPATAPSPAVAATAPSTELAAMFAVVLPAGADVDRAVAAAEHAAGTGGAARVVPAADAYLAPYLDDVGIELSDADRRGLAASHDAIEIQMTGARADVADLQHRGAAAAQAVLAASGGWPVDVATARVFSRAAFERDFAADFALEAKTLVVTHWIRQAHGMLDIDTMGMTRFGLPELRVRGVPQNRMYDVDGLVLATAQALLDGVPVDHGAITLDLHRLRQAPWPDLAALVDKQGGTGRVRWTVTPSTDEDDHGETLDLTPAGGSGPEALGALLNQTLGHQDDMQYVDDDPEILAAGARARAAVAALAPHMAHGVPADERLGVEAPFPTRAGGIEWMWVDVHRWEGNTMTGILLNEPDDVADLHEGATVTVDPTTIDDYAYRRADGTEEHGDLAEILEKKRGAN